MSKQNLRKWAGSLCILSLLLAETLVLPGCFSIPQSNYRLKTPEELASQLKRGFPVPLSDSVPLPSQGAEKLVGEWEIDETTLCQVDLTFGAAAHQTARFITIQFFDDGTYSEIIKVVGCGVSSVWHGTWEYVNGTLKRRMMNDGVLQRLPTEHLIWRKDNLVEKRQDLDEHKKHYFASSSGKVYAVSSYYDADGFFITEADQEIAGNRTKSIQVSPPTVMKRIGDVAKPSAALGLKDPIIHDEMLKVEVEREQRLAEQRSAEIAATAEMTQAIAQGVNAFSSALAQQASSPPSPASQPVVEQQSASGQSSKQTKFSRPIVQTQRIVRPSSFFVGEKSDGTPKVSDQSYRDGKYKQ